MGLNSSAGSALVPAVNSGGCSSSQTHSRAVPARIAAARSSMKAKRFLVGHEPVAHPPFDVVDVRHARDMARAAGKRCNSAPPA